MARMTAEVLEEFLEKPIIAVLATTRPNRPPYQTPVWFLWQQTGPRAAAYPHYPEGVFWLTGTYARTWCTQILNDPRVSLCIEATDPVARYVAVECRAALVEEDIWPVSTALARKYVGGRPGATEAGVERFLANMRTEPRLLFRLTPERWRAIDLTVYTGVPRHRTHPRAGRDRG